MGVILLGGGLVLLPSSANASEVAPPQELRIYGGEPAKACEWPTSVGLGGCTGTLVHPRIMLSAAHCRTPRKVQFGEAYGKSIVKTVSIDWCEKNPDFKMREGDFAFCYLKKAVTDVPIAPIAYGCEVEQVKEGANIWLVGFGSREDGGSVAKYKVEIPNNAENPQFVHRKEKEMRVMVRAGVEIVKKGTVLRMNLKTTQRRTSPRMVRGGGTCWAVFPRSGARMPRGR